MQSVQGTDAMTSPTTSLPSSKNVFIKWALLGSVGILNGYATILMYSRGEIAFALLTLIITALALYIFGSKKDLRTSLHLPRYRRHDFIHPVPAGVHRWSCLH